MATPIFKTCNPDAYIHTVGQIQLKHTEIISIFRKDKAAGITTLYEGYGRQLYGYSIQQWQLDEDEAYDALYKTLENTARAILTTQFESERHFMNWLFRIHKNNLLQLVRAKRAKEADLQVYSLEDWYSGDTDADGEDGLPAGYDDVLMQLSAVNPYKETQEASEMMQALEAALQQVTDTERELLLLRMSNYTYDEIARMLGIENNQLKVKFIRAKAKVQKKTLAILKERNDEKARKIKTL